MESPITFVCCVASRLLEAQTVQMIESLRRWGGRLAQASIVAATPSWVPPLSHKIDQAFERLQMEYLHFQSGSRYSWLAVINKPYALVAAQERSTTKYIGWLDSDLLFVGEPDLLSLKEEKKKLKQPGNFTIMMPCYLVSSLSLLIFSAFLTQREQTGFPIKL